jgi:hypothetical protein
MTLNATVSSVKRSRILVNGDPIVWVEAEITLTAEARATQLKHIGADPLKLTGFEPSLPLKLGAKVTIEIEEG